MLANLHSNGLKTGVCTDERVEDRGVQCARIRFSYPLSVRIRGQFISVRIRFISGYPSADIRSLTTLFESSHIGRDRNGSQGSASVSLSQINLLHSTDRSWQSAPAHGPLQIREWRKESCKLQCVFGRKERQSCKEGANSRHLSAGSVVVGESDINVPVVLQIRVSSRTGF